MKHVTAGQTLGSSGHWGETDGAAIVMMGELLRTDTLVTSIQIHTHTPKVRPRSQLLSKAL